MKFSPTKLTSARSLLAASIAGYAVSLSVPAAAADDNWRCEAVDGQWQCREVEPLSADYRYNDAPPTAPDVDELRMSRAYNLDWVNIDNMTPEQRAKVPVNCCGAFVEPVRQYEGVELDPEQAQLDIFADVTEAEGSTAILRGDVQVSQGYRQVRADEASINQDTGEVELHGNIQFREPGLLILGDSAQVNIRSKDIRLENTEYVFHEGSVHGSARLLERTVDNKITITDTSYSSCEPGDNIWELKTDSVSIDLDSGFATARNARLHIYDVPVFYIPWVRFPASDKRASGLLFPHTEFGSENGFDYSQPIYWNMAPNYDATFTPRFVQHRGAMMGAEFRHLTQTSYGEVAGSFLPDDKGGNGDDLSSNGLPLYDGANRWMGRADYQGGIGEAFWQKIDYTRISDDDYFRDFGSQTIERNSTTHLLQQGILGYRTANWNNQLRVQQFQTIIADAQDQYRILPRITANGSYRWGNVGFQAGHEITEFDHDDTTLVTGRRLRLDYQLDWTKRWQWGYFTPAVMMRHLNYDLDLPANSALTEQSPSATVPGFSLDSTLYFERPFKSAVGYQQTLEPRLYYLYRRSVDQSAFPDFDTRAITSSFASLFYSDRFNGGDRVGDFERLSIGVTSRLLDERGRERAVINIGQAFHFRDRKVQLNTGLPDNTLTDQETPLAVELRARINDNWNARAETVYDTTRTTIEKTAAGVNYRDNDGHIFNLSYRYTRDDAFTPGIVTYGAIKEVDVSGYLPLTGGWNLVSRWNYDFEFKRDLEVFAGVEYNSCCWRASLVARRWLSRNDRLLNPQDELEHRTGVFFQIQFKGLAGTGSRVDRILSDGIFGYEPRTDF